MSEWIDRKYVGILSNRLDLYKVKSTHPFTANFRCPVCGDSKKNKWKARGYLFSKKGGIFYKCHNCTFSSSFSNLLKQVDHTLYNQYTLEQFKEGKQVPVSNTLPNFVFEQPKFKEKTILDQLFVPVAGTEAEQYLIDRKVPTKAWGNLYYVDDSQKLEQLSVKYEGRVLGSDPRLVIPFYDSDGSLVGVNCRALNDCNLRYITVRIDDNRPLIYNLDKVDRSKTIYVTEGPIDSMFLDNAVAVGNSDLAAISNALPKDNVVLVFDNQPRNAQLVSTMIEAASQQHRMVVWPDYLLQKDINEMVLNDVDNVLEIIDNNTFQGLQLTVQINQWKKV
jgi:transcription elongation factor Elf1